MHRVRDKIRGARNVNGREKKKNRRKSYAALEPRLLLQGSTVIGGNIVAKLLGRLADWLVGSINNL